MARWPWVSRRWHEEQVARLRSIHAARQQASSDRMNARISTYAAETRERIAAANAEADERARRTIEQAEHRARVAATALAAERERDRIASFERGVELGRREAQEAANFLTKELAQVDRSTPCEKIRLNDEAHALEMVRHVLETAGVRTEPYTCPVCPRQLFDRGRFWHVRTIDDPAEKARRDAVVRGQVPRVKRERQLRSRLSPDQLALLEAKKQQP